MPTKKRKNRKQRKFTVTDSHKRGIKGPFSIPAVAMADPLGSKVRMMEGSRSEGRRSFRTIAAIILASLFLCLAVAFAVMYAVANSSSATSLSSSGKVNMGNANKVCCKGQQKSFSPWSYTCTNNQCIKGSGIPKQQSQLLTTCKTTCGQYGSLWPRPRTKSIIGNNTVAIIPSNVLLNQIVCKNSKCNSIANFVKRAFNIFFNITREICTKDSTAIDPSLCNEESKSNKVQIKISLKSQDTKLTLSTSEAYELKIVTQKNIVSVNINADTFYGARHALETLSQLISYDMLSDSLQIVSSADVADSPAFPYRGLMLDTSRNFFSVKSILKLLDAMSYNKLNTFHWHITDTHSFPILIKQQPNMTYYGAYSERQIYSVEDVKRIVDHAEVRGIRVLPEFDQPAHAGNGWQWSEGAGLGTTAFCVNQKPWQNYCVEPPCGQLNPLNDNTYKILESIYSDYLAKFSPDLFHFGGDEVNIGCWNTSQPIIDWMKSMNKTRTFNDFMDLWNMFLVAAEKKFKAQSKQDIPLIVWSSKMTEEKYLTKYLNNKTYIIQLWNVATDKSIPNILKNGFKVILSNYDHTYLDCGFGSWVADGNNWCSPYKQWQLQYNLNPGKFVKHFNLSSDNVNQILGGETNMWSEQVDENALEMKIWPRSAALAERMWSNPNDGWRAAEPRLLHHRQRLVDRGIQADALKPLWCYQNSGYCRG